MVTIETQPFCSSFPRRNLGRLINYPTYAGMIFRQEAFYELAAYYSVYFKVG